MTRNFMTETMLHLAENGWYTSLTAGAKGPGDLFFFSINHTELSGFLFFGVGPTPDEACAIAYKNWSEYANRRISDAG